MNIRNVPACFALAALIAGAQQPDAKQAVAAKVNALKESLAKSQASLRTYEWIESTDISLKGEVKKQSQKKCYYDVSGKVIKVDTGGGSGGGGKKRGIKGKIVEKKVGELTEYMDRVGALVHHYVPPDSGKIQAAFQSGNVSITPGANPALTIKNYYKQGDAVTITLNAATNQLVSYQVQTFLDEPSDAVGMTAKWSALPDGTSYVSATLLSAKAKEVDVKVTNLGHRKAGG